jgi:hypothetical protein
VAASPPVAPASGVPPGSTTPTRALPRFRPRTDDGRYAEPAPRRTRSAHHLARRVIWARNRGVPAAPPVVGIAWSQTSATTSNSVTSGAWAGPAGPSVSRNSPRSRSNRASSGFSSKTVTAAVAPVARSIPKWAWRKPGWARIRSGKRPSTSGQFRRPGLRVAGHARSACTRRTLLTTPPAPAGARRHHTATAFVPLAPPSPASRCHLRSWPKRTPGDWGCPNQVAASEP